MNWKYILGEILLIFVGINLAIWFNDWNASKKTDSDKKIAIEKIEEEIRNNLDELLTARENNNKLAEALVTYKESRTETSKGMVATMPEMIEFQDKYPGFFTISDTLELSEGKYDFDGDVFLNLELAELSKIAWETSKTTAIVNEFDYECLFDLEGTYNLQALVANEMSKAASALQNREIDQLQRILDFIRQVDLSLEADYKRSLEEINNCM
nr:hypothetical protein [Allomuricauda sp.]